MPWLPRTQTQFANELLDSFGWLFVELISEYLSSARTLHQQQYQHQDQHQHHKQQQQQHVLALWLYVYLCVCEGICIRNGGIAVLISVVWLFAVSF